MAALAEPTRIVLHQSATTGYSLPGIVAAARGATARAAKCRGESKDRDRTGVARATPHAAWLPRPVLPKLAISLKRKPEIASRRRSAATRSRGIMGKLNLSIAVGDYDRTRP